jgi:hypothetical protein
MSRMAPFIDGGRPFDRTNWSNTVISYYPFGGAIALALDLTLRDRSDGRITLDDFMRAMWRVHGKPGGTREGYVDRPYTIDDAEARLAGSAATAALPAFSRAFKERRRSYPHLLRAGLVLRTGGPRVVGRSQMNPQRQHTLPRSCPRGVAPGSAERQLRDDGGRVDPPTMWMQFFDGAGRSHWVTFVDGRGRRDDQRHARGSASRRRAGRIGRRP